MPDTDVGVSPTEDGVWAGVIDEETGAVTVERSTIRMIDGKPYAVVSTNHFTSRVYTDPAAYILSVSPNETAELNLSFSASLAPTSWWTGTSPTDSFYRELSAITWRIDTELAPVTGSSPTLEQGGVDGHRTHPFTRQKRGDTFRVHISVLVWVNVYKDGKVYCT